jgi:Type IV secretion system pilin
MNITMKTKVAAGMMLLVLLFGLSTALHTHASDFDDPEDNSDNTPPATTPVTTTPGTTVTPGTTAAPAGGGGFGTPTGAPASGVGVPQSTTQPAKQGKLPVLSNPLFSSSVEEIITTIVDIAMNLGIALAIIMLIYAGFRFVWARGNASELDDAKHLLLYIIIGLAVLISAKAIVGIVKNTLIQANVVKASVFNKPN